MDKLKLVYDVADIIQLLNIDKNSAYKLVKSNQFPVRKVGVKYLIPIKTFEEWLYATSN